jgi:NADH:ubiquinone oxidoreductase subunit C
MEQAAIAEKLQAHLGERVLTSGAHRGQHWITVGPESLRGALSFMASDAEIAVDMLTDIGGVDYLGYGDDREWRFEIAYQVHSLALNHRFRVKVAVADETTEVPSVWDMYGVANWMEREVYDLLGIRFEGHPNLRRILCHEDFQGHALRKDYPINKRQQLSRPIENLLTDEPEWA